MTVPLRAYLALTMAVLVCLMAPRPSAGQTAATAAPPPVAATATDPDTQADDPSRVSLPEPDYRIVSLPTTLRLPTHKSSFTLTHRFNGNLRAQSFTENLSNLFGLDQGAAIGLEYRFAVLRNVQAVVYRCNISKTFEFSGKYDALHQHAGMPVSLSAVVSVEGLNNFQQNYQPGIAFVASRFIGSRVAVYAEPTYVAHTAAEIGSSQGTWFVGIGGRARITRRTYLVAEISPRIDGYAPGTEEFAFGIETRVGGHVFQLNFANTSSTTPGQIARGGFPNSLFLGFNLSRKFF